MEPADPEDVTIGELRARKAPRREENAVLAPDPEDVTIGELRCLNRSSAAQPKPKAKLHGDGTDPATPLTRTEPQPPAWSAMAVQGSATATAAGPKRKRSEAVAAAGPKPAVAAAVLRTRDTNASAAAPKAKPKPKPKPNAGLREKHLKSAYRGATGPAAPPTPAEPPAPAPLAAAADIVEAAAGEAEAWWRKGAVVEVQSRTWPGINKPGGVGRITKVSFDLEEGPVCSVRYVLGGSEKDVPKRFVAPPGESNKREQKAPKQLADEQAEERSAENERAASRREQQRRRREAEREQEQQRRVAGNAARCLHRKSPSVEAAALRVEPAVAAVAPAVPQLSNVLGGNWTATANAAAAAAAAKPAEPSRQARRAEVFEKSVQGAFRHAGEESLTLKEILGMLDKEGSDAFTEAEAGDFLLAMQDDNKLMYIPEEGTVYII